MSTPHSVQSSALGFGFGFGFGRVLVCVWTEAVLAGLGGVRNGGVWDREVERKEAVSSDQ